MVRRLPWSTMTAEEVVEIGAQAVEGKGRRFKGYDPRRHCLACLREVRRADHTQARPSLIFSRKYDPGRKNYTRVKDAPTRCYICRRCWERGDLFNGEHVQHTRSLVILAAAFLRGAVTWRA